MAIVKIALVTLAGRFFLPKFLGYGSFYDIPVLNILFMSV